MPGDTLLQNATATGIENFLVDTLGVPSAYSQLAAGILIFIVALLGVYLIGRIIVVPLVSRVLQARDLDDHARKPILRLTRYGMVFVAVSVAFGAAGFGSFLQSLATVAAAATLAIGFAMQDVIANFVAGVFIYVERPFRIGDWIEWDGNSGIVDDISLRVTRVRTFDNELLTVPNSQLTDGVVKNPVANDELRLKFLFGIGYDDDIETATDIILEEARKHDDILDDPEPSVRLTELGDSSVGLQSRIWIADPRRTDFVRIRGEYVTAVKRRFDEVGIDIPYPIRTLDGGIAVTGSELVTEAGED